MTWRNFTDMLCSVCELKKPVYRNWLPRNTKTSPQRAKLPSVTFSPSKGRSIRFSVCTSSFSIVLSLSNGISRDGLQCSQQNIAHSKKEHAVSKAQLYRDSVSLASSKRDEALPKLSFWKEQRLQRRNDIAKCHLFVLVEPPTHYSACTSSSSSLLFLSTGIRGSHSSTAFSTLLALSSSPATVLSP